MARINTNIAALNALRNLNKTEKATATTLERLSSGKRLNRAADGPAALVISEQMNAQVASLGQAISNSETSVSMLQTAEGALSEVSSILVNLRQLAIHAANNGASDEGMLLADQSEIDNLLGTLERIATTTQFGTRSLLDGSNATRGVAVGNGIEFISAGVDTKPSPTEGYAVNVTQVATRPMLVATQMLPLEEALGTFVINEGNRSAVLDIQQNKVLHEEINRILNATLRQDEPMDQVEAQKVIQQLIASELQAAADAGGLELDIFVYRPVDSVGELISDASLDLDEFSQVNNWPGELKDLVDEEVIVIRHRDFGSKPKFNVTTSIEGFFDEEALANESVAAVPGRDIEGTIGGDPIAEAGEPAIGNGQYLSAAPGSTAEGLTIRYTQDTDDVLYQIFSREDNSFRGLYLDEKSNDVLVGDAKEGAGVFGEVIPEIEGHVHVTQNALAFQVGANQGQQVKVSIPGTRPDDLAKGVKNESSFKSLNDINVLTPQAAQDTIDVIDAAISEISGVRAKLGAFQKNALESNLNSLHIAKEKLSAAKSELQDTDMAAEMSNLVRNQILREAGTAMLAQANQAPRTVLQLLQAQ